jgi:3-isopropylmalate/(R)-2-methylmalate dehydratase small subunit
VIIDGHGVVVPGTNVDTDVLYPGSFLNIDDPALMKPYLFEGLDPSLRDRLGEDPILVTGVNFGMGSSREHVPQAMKAWGVRCVLGHSFARIFHRNCINLGLSIVTCPEAAAAAHDRSRIEIDTDSGEVVVDGASYQAAPIPAFMLDMIAAGGLVPYAQAQLSAR